MSHDSLRNKQLVEFPDGKLLLFCEVSDSSIRGWNNKRVWERCLIHPKGTLFYTKETLKQEQTDYVNRQLEWLRSFHKQQVEQGWENEYVEPTLESYDYGGTVFPGGSKIKNGRAFYSGVHTIKAEEFFAQWDSPRRIIFSAYDKDFKCIYNVDYDILASDVDECYQDALKANKKVYIDIK